MWRVAGPGELLQACKNESILAATIFICFSFFPASPNPLFFFPAQKKNVKLFHIRGGGIIRRKVS